MKKVPEVNAAKCTYCQDCQLACSYYLTGRFNPAQARIRVGWEDGATIAFSEDCTACGECARACLYGAIREEGSRS